jgi:prolyl 4-hydroxylase
MFADHLDLAHPLMWTIDDALSPERCAAYIAKFAASTPEQAPVITRAGVEVDLAVRNNLRLMWDDEAEANELAARVRPPPTWKTHHLVGGNPRLRIYRYEPGEQHSTHWDTVVELADNIASRITLVFYLNDDFTGGETEFPELKQRITPKRGSALLFQHRVLHAALTPTTGIKYVLRTDVLYRSGTAARAT